MDIYEEDELYGDVYDDEFERDLFNDYKNADMLYEGAPADSSGLDLYIRVYEEYESRFDDFINDPDDEEGLEQLYGQANESDEEYSNLQFSEICLADPYVISIKVSKLNQFDQGAIKLWYRVGTKFLYWASFPKQASDICVAEANKILIISSDPLDIFNFFMSTKRADNDIIQVRILLPRIDKIKEFLWLKERRSNIS